LRRPQTTLRITLLQQPARDTPVTYDPTATPNGNDASPMKLWVTLAGFPSRSARPIELGKLFAQ
jgi:hypothetical protein